MPDTDLPGYSQDRLGWQAPTVLPTSSLAELARSLQSALQGIYKELVALGSRRNVVALQGDTQARAGQVIAGVAAGQVIALPAPNPGEFGTISVLLFAVKSAVTVVNPDASTFVLSLPGLYEFGVTGDDAVWRAVSPAAPIALSSLAAQAANTVVANATAAAASPTAFPVGTNTVLGRVGANIVAAQLVGAQVAAATLPLTTLATQPANTVLANATAGVASPTAITVGAESVLGQTSGNLQGIASAVQTALIRAAGSVFWAAAAANQVLRRSGAGDLGMGLLVDTNLTANTISAASQAQMAANTVKSNATAALANESDLAVGTNTVLGRAAGNIVAATAVNAQLAAMTANSFKAEATGAAVAPQDVAISAQSVLGRAAANIVNLTAAADQVLGRVGSGNLGFSPTPRLLRAPQVLTSGTTISHPTGTQVLKLRGVGGGGASGGLSATAGSIGGAGGSGTYGEKTFVVPAASSTFAVGAAGTGVSGANGNPGGSSTFTNGATTVTLPGGLAGTFLAGAATVSATAGGGTASGATNADWSIQGQGGGDSMRPVAATTPNVAGPGGSNPLGFGGAEKWTGTTQLAALPGTGFGAGGPGRANGTTATAAAGNNGQPGVWIVEEWG